MTEDEIVGFGTNEKADMKEDVAGLMMRMRDT